MNQLPDDPHQDDVDAFLAGILSGENPMPPAEWRAQLKRANVEIPDMDSLQATLARAEEIRAWERELRRDATESVTAEELVGSEQLLATVMREALRSDGDSDRAARVDSFGSQRAGSRSRGPWLIKGALTAAAAVFLAFAGWRILHREAALTPVNPGITLGRDTAVLTQPAPGSTIERLDRLEWVVDKQPEDELRLSVETLGADGRWVIGLVPPTEFLTVDDGAWTASPEQSAKLVGKIRISLQIVPRASAPLPKGDRSEGSVINQVE